MGVKEHFTNVWIKYESLKLTTLCCSYNDHKCIVAVILTGACWPAEWGADEFVGNWSRCHRLLTAEESLSALVSYQPLNDPIKDTLCLIMTLRSSYFTSLSMSILCICREPGLLRAESFSLTDRCLSNDSIKASSGEVSPYDNNSPVLSDRLLCKHFEDSGPLPDSISRLSGQFKRSSWSKHGSGSTSPTLSTDKGEHIVECEPWQNYISKEKVMKFRSGKKESAAC